MMSERAQIPIVLASAVLVGCVNGEPTDEASAVDIVETDLRLAAWGRFFTGTEQTGLLF